jgi:hypothetical protein
MKRGFLMMFVIAFSPHCGLVSRFSSFGSFFIECNVVFPGEITFTRLPQFPGGYLLPADTVAEIIGAGSRENLLQERLHHRGSSLNLASDAGF